MESSVDIICRICLLGNKQQVNLFSTSDTNPSYFDKLSLCVPWMNVSQNDFHPCHICRKCCELLDSAYTFHQLCMESDKRLRQIADGFVFVKIEAKEEPEPECNDIETATVVKKELTSYERPRKIRKNVAQYDENGKQIQRKCIAKFECEITTVVKKELTSCEPPIKIRKNAARYNENGKKIRRKRIAKFECDICGKRMVGKFTLEQHIRIHSGVRPFVCELCGRSFATNGSLTKHLDTHNKNRYKRLKCNLCPYETDRYNHYQRHVIIHTGDRPFKCNICGQTSNSQGNLRTHIKKMHSEPSHKCDLCDRKFRTIGLKRRHTIIHYLDVHYLCPECDKTYPAYRVLVAHVKRHHPDITCPSKSESCIQNSEIKSK